MTPADRAVLDERLARALAAALVAHVHGEMPSLAESVSEPRASAPKHETAPACRGAA